MTLIGLLGRREDVCRTENIGKVGFVVGRSGAHVVAARIHNEDIRPELPRILQVVLPTHSGQGLRDRAIVC